ncbi:MAG: rhodanese-like domain-containing protein [Bacteroidales bacterium]|nr:rhodanese-like domain-containing protein [Bacteroidales bacterium]
MMNKFRYILTCVGMAMCMSACQQPVTRGELHSVDAESFKLVIRNSNVQIIDVRTRAEFLKGHLPHAINIDINDNDFNGLVRQHLEPERPVAVYCHSGKKSEIAANIMIDLGYEVYELENGVLGWDGPVSIDQQ